MSGAGSVTEESEIVPAQGSLPCDCGWPGPEYGPHEPDCASLWRANGEGFAFFRWHALAFFQKVNEPHTCQRHFGCHRLWEKGLR